MRDARRGFSALGATSIHRIHRQTLLENFEYNVGLAGQFEGYC
jgi:hypothetical protein